MGKIRAYFLPVIIISISILVMLSGEILKKPMSSDDNFEKYIKNLEMDLKTSNWQDAEDNIKKLMVAWRKVQKRVQFSVERDDMNRLSLSLARIEGAVKSKNRDSALVDLYEALEHWENLEE